MKNVSDKSCIENQNTHFTLKNFFSTIMLFMRQRKNTGEPGMLQKQYGAIALHAV